MKRWLYRLTYTRRVAQAKRRLLGDAEAREKFRAYIAYSLAVAFRALDNWPASHAGGPPNARLLALAFVEAMLPRDQAKKVAEGVAGVSMQLSKRGHEIASRALELVGYYFFAIAAGDEKGMAIIRAFLVELFEGADNFLTAEWFTTTQERWPTMKELMENPL